MGDRSHAINKTPVNAPAPNAVTPADRPQGNVIIIGVKRVMPGNANLNTLGPKTETAPTQNLLPTPWG